LAPTVQNKGAADARYNNQTKRVHVNERKHMSNEIRFKRSLADAVMGVLRRPSSARKSSAVSRAKTYALISAVCAWPLFYVVTFFAPVAHAQIKEGAARDALVRSTADSCVESQTASPANKSIPRDRIVRFCNCYAKAVADTVTPEEVDAMGKGQAPDTIQKKAQAASAQCLKQ
jgi:hypothetical protein